MQERDNSSASAMALCLSCTNPSMYSILAQAIKYKYLCLLKHHDVQKWTLQLTRIQTYSQIYQTRKCCHFDEIFITGCTGSCHFDNIQCKQWQNSIKMMTFPFHWPDSNKTKVRNFFNSFFFQVVMGLRCSCYDDIYYIHVNFIVYLLVTDYSENFRTSSKTLGSVEILLTNSFSLDLQAF